MRTRSVRFGHACLVALLCSAGLLLSSHVTAQGPAAQRQIDRVNGYDAVAGDVIVKYINPRTAGERAQADATISATKV